MDSPKYLIIWIIATTIYVLSLKIISKNLDFSIKYSMCYSLFYNHVTAVECSFVWRKNAILAFQEVNNFKLN